VSDKGDKTEKPTAKRLKEARKEGRTPRTPELGQWLTMLAASFMLPLTIGLTDDRVRDLLAQVPKVASDPDPAVVLLLLRDIVVDAGVCLAPLVLVILLTGVLSTAGQGGLFLATKAAKPKVKRINPWPGIKRMFGAHGLGEAAKALFKTIVFGLLAFWAVKDLMVVLTAGGTMSLSSAAHVTWDATIRLVRVCCGMGLVFAAGDYAMKRKQAMSGIKMSHQDIKQEHRQSEGDPHVKGQRRSAQLAMSRNRMMSEVAHADVVLVNPTHVAVALRYVPGSGAPEVVAKGAGAVAARIRELAEENRVPMVRDVPLARALHGACKVGDTVPPELFEAVARVLAFVFGLRARGRSAAGTHTVRAA
jgi:flagellar biosynthetic protein FlhB